jgi:hypothetical protein
MYRTMAKESALSVTRNTWPASGVRSSRKLGRIEGNKKAEASKPRPV